VELLVAMALVIIFGSMAVAVLRYGIGLWRAGHRRSHAYDMAATVFRQVENDLNAARSQFWGTDVDAYDTRVKFWVDFDADGTAMLPVEGAGRQRLRLVRGIPANSVNPRIRQAGDGEDNDNEYYNALDDDGDGRADEDLMPLEGLCEVAYLMGTNDGAVPGADDHTTLYRAVLAPIGGTAPTGFLPPADYPGYSLFRDDAADADEDVFYVDPSGSPNRIQAKAVPLAENVLHFEVRCWSQYTTTWVPEPFAPWRNPYAMDMCGPTFTWDNERLNAAADVNTPPFVMDWGQPGFSEAADDDADTEPNGVDEDYVRDNVFPRALMVVLVVDPYAEYPATRPLRLAADMDADQETVVVAGEPPAHNSAWPYFRIVDEWLAFESFDADTQTYTLVSDGRGMRGTTASAHSAGDLVRFGYTFTRAFHNPAGRDY
jgi:hypothetical protein